MQITKENLIDLLLDPNSRSILINKVKSEASENRLTTINQISHLAPTVVIDEDKIRQLKKILLYEEEHGTALFEEFIFNPDFPKALLHELFDEGKCLSNLAHRSGPLDFLLRLCREQNLYGEPVLTVGNHYFYSKHLSLDKFEAFLREFKDVEWLFTNFVHKISKMTEQERQQEKVVSFLNIIKIAEHHQDIFNLYNDLLMEKELIKTTDILLIQAQHKTQNPRLLRAMAQNSTTPIPILQKLELVKDIKYAGMIRQLATSTLKEIWDR